LSKGLTIGDDNGDTIFVDVESQAIFILYHDGMYVEKICDSLDELLSNTCDAADQGHGLNPTRMELIAALVELSTLDPEQRFGQLISNLATHADGPFREQIWDIDDQALLMAAQRFVHERKERNAAMAREQERQQQ
jgi:hypothetical protein